MLLKMNKLVIWYASGYLAGVVHLHVVIETYYGLC